MNLCSSNRPSSSVESGLNVSSLDLSIGNGCAKPSTIQSSSPLPNTSDLSNTSSSHSRSTVNEATEHHAAFVDTEDYDRFSDYSGELSPVADELPVLGTCVALHSFSGELRVFFRTPSLF